MRFFNVMFDTDKTFRPKKKHKEGTERYKLHNFAKSLIESEDLNKIVELPPGANLLHWLSMNTIDFYNLTNACYGPLTQYCTSSTCPIMSSGAQYEYLWRDPRPTPRPPNCPPPSM